MYQGFFINLARNEKRRDALVRHLEEIGAAPHYRRFEAVDGRAVAGDYNTTLDPGNLGLWLSNLNLLNSNRGTDRHLHIVEDDTVFAKDAVALFSHALAVADKHLPGWDLLFTDIYVPCDLNTFRLFSEKMSAWQANGTAYALVDLEQIAFACTSSFFVNRSSVDKLANVLAGQWAAGLPIDLYLRHLVQQRHLKAHVTMPFLTSLGRENVDSDIRGNTDLSRKVCNILRRAFFKEADTGALLEEMQELTKNAKLAPLARIFVDTLSFALSDQWVSF